MASNQISTVDNRQIDVHNETETDDEDEDEHAKVNCKTEIGTIDLKNCKEPHLGNRTDYYGPVRVKTFYKINVPNNQTIMNASHVNPINLSRPFDYSAIGPSSSRETFVPVTASELAAAALLDRSRLPSSEDQIESDPTSISTNDISDRTSLLTGVNKSKTKQILYFGAAVLGILIMIIVLIVEIVLYYQLKPSSGDNLPMNFSQRLVTRGEWFAFQPKHELKPFNIEPVPFVVVAHTSGTECYDKPLCRTVVRNIQGGQMSGNYDDIAYNYLVAGDGYIYEGRGWYHTSGVNPKVNCSAIFIAFIGNFNVQLPPLKQMDAFKLLLDEGVSNGTLAQDYKMFMHKQISNTESPGAALINVLINWQHWKPFGKQDLLCDHNVTVA